MTKEKLDLIQFTAREVAETSTRAPQIVRRKPVDPGASSCGTNDVPE